MSGLFSLDGRKALVTGANTGIGQAIAVSLAGQGAEVVCAGRRTCDETVAMIEAAGGTASSLILDFADPLAARDTFTGAGYSILVNNAGIIRRADSVDYSEEDWDAVIDTNLKALFFTCKAFGKALIGTGRPGAIVNIASLLSFQGGIRVPAYTASKHGMTGLTKATSLDGRKYNIACGQIDIGNAATEMAAPMARGIPQANGEIAVEPTMDVEHVAQAVVHMAELPLESNVQFMTIMATKMPFIGRG